MVLPWQQKFRLAKWGSRYIRESKKFVFLQIEIFCACLEPRSIHTLEAGHPIIRKPRGGDCLSQARWVVWRELLPTTSGCGAGIG